MNDRFQVVVGHQGFPVVDPDIDLRSARAGGFQVLTHDLTGLCLLRRGNRVLQVQGDDVCGEFRRFCHHLLVVARNIKY
jgi:hypothetical protein